MLPVLAKHKMKVSSSHGILWCTVAVFFRRCPTGCHGAAFTSRSSPTSTTTTLLNNWFSLFAPAPPQPDDDPFARGRRLLTELDIVDAEPPLQPQQIPTLLSTSLVTLLRGTCGVWTCDYRVGWQQQPQPPPQTATTTTTTATPSLPYSAWRPWGGALGQLEETGFVPAQQQQQPLQLYEIESDAACRLVREACSMLSLTVTFYPATGPHYRPAVAQQFPGFPAADFPYLYDPNTSVRLSGCPGSLEYLFAMYGGRNADSGDRRRIPSALWQESDWPLWTATLALQVLRLGAGGRYRPSRFKYNKEDNGDQPLKLWAYEGLPAAKLVRELLSELELPHTCVYAPRGSTAPRQALYERTNGKFQRLPYLEDPNTGVQLFEPHAMCEYLRKYYGLATPKATL